jgi:iron complex outermembrane receptor protein
MTFESGRGKIGGRIAAAALAGVSLLALNTALHAQPADVPSATAHPDRVVNVSVPGGSLESGLLSLGRQANLRMLYPSNLTAGKRTAGVSGQVTPQQAVTQLLAGTGLRASFTSRNTVQVFDPSTSDAGGAMPTGAIALDTIDVQGAGNPNSTMTPMPAYAGGQVATGGQLGLLGNRGVMNTPFNQTSYTAAKIQQQQATTLRDVLIDDPSVRPQLQDGGPGADTIRMRGFLITPNNFTFGGLYGVLPTFSVMPELADRIDVLKGPSAMLLGIAPNANSIGGSINIVPKHAPDEPLTQLTTSYASAARIGAHVDVARRFGDDKQFGVRFNGVYRDGDTAVQFNSDQRALGILGLDYRGERVRVSADLGYQYQRINGVISYLGVNPGVPLPTAPDASKNRGQPWAYNERKAQFGVIRGEVDVTENVTAYAAFGGSDNRLTGFSGFQVNATNANGNAIGTILYTNPDQTRSLSGEAGVRARINTGPIDHEVAFTATRLAIEAGGNSAVGTPFATNFYNPAIIPRPNPPLLVPLNRTNSDLSSVGVADTLSMLDKRVQLTAGARLQNVEVASFSGITGGQLNNYNANALSPSVALVVKPFSDNVSFYANWIEGLQPGTTVGPGFANAGQTFSPFTSTQYEAGVKVDWGRITTTASVFQITLPNLLIDAATNTQNLDGEQRNRGLELNVFGEVTERVRVLGGAMFLDPVLTKTQGGLTDGWQARSAPRFQFNLAGEWDTPFMQGLTLTGRVVYTGAQYFDTTLPRRILPDWTRYDLGARYTFNNPALNGKLMTARFTVENVFDANYYQNGDGATFLALGAPRTFRLSLTTDF